MIQPTPQYLAVSFEEAEGTQVEVIVTPKSSVSATRSPADILTEIAAIVTPSGTKEYTSRDHDKILYGEQGGAAMNWIFQSNPKYYDLPGAVTSLRELVWSVKQSPKQIHAGDTVYLWEAGANAGIVAVGEIISEPTMMVDDEDKVFHRDTQRFRPEALRVRIRITSVLPERILRVNLLEDPVLRNMLILRRPSATNFKLTDEEAARLERMIGS